MLYNLIASCVVFNHRNSIFKKGFNSNPSMQNQGGTSWDNFGIRAGIRGRNSTLVPTSARGC